MNECCRGNNLNENYNLFQQKAVGLDTEFNFLNFIDRNYIY